MKRFWQVGILIAALLSTSFVASATENSAETFKAAPEPGLGYMGYTAYPVSAAVSNLSGLLGMETTGDRVNSVRFCTSLSDPDCSKSDYFQYSAYYPMCASTTDLDCIEEITATSSAGQKLQVTTVKEFSSVKRNQYEGKPAVGLPSGSSPTLFTVADAPHSLGTQYMAAVTSYGYIDTRVFPTTVMENGSLSIFAVSATNGIFQPHDMASTPASYAGKRWRSSNGGDYSCSYTDGATCAKAGPMPLDVTFGVKVRYSTPIKGWFHGRVQDPAIVYKAGDGNSKVLSVSAKAVQVPAITTWKKKEELSQELKDFYARASKPLGGSGSGAGKTELQQGPESGWSLMRLNNAGYTQEDFNEFLAWLPMMGEKANLAPIVWTMNLMTNYSSGVLGSTCKTSDDELSGMVSTNSTQYLAGPPSFNRATGELEYKVAGPHLMPNGELSRGTYDLSLKAEFARCLYGISGTAVRATVSIISESGTVVNAVTVVNEKNGWLNFAARGFTYSSPTIKVKLTDVNESKPEANPTPSATPSATPSTKPAVTKKVTISCVKGKSVKKVTSVAPKCPAGYKKKS
ncbi:MAG: hypothetical protein RI899_880 [Actinomycetota bacterium]